jgi:hypothetical protein
VRSRAIVSGCAAHARHHLHQGRRSPRAGQRLASADHPEIRLAAGVSVGTKDISLAGRILATFPEHLTEDQRIPMTWPNWASW